MTDKLAKLDQSVLIVVDIQPTFMKPIVGMDAALARCKFMIECAQVLEVPVLATEQYPERMGGTHPEILDLLDEEAIGKITFSCCGNEQFSSAMDSLGRNQAILIGIETPICVLQTTHELLSQDYEVFIAEDATAGRSVAMHGNAIERMRAAGAVIAHTESIVFEWLKSGDNPKFREILKLIKQYAG